MISSLPLVTVLILNYNGRRVLKKCLERVHCQTYKNMEVILVDNCSTDNSVYLAAGQYPWLKIVQTGNNLGYAGGNNFGSHFAKGEYLAILNNDAYPEDQWLENIVPIFSNDRSIAVVGCKIYKEGSMVLDSAGAYIDFPLGFAPQRGVGLLGSSAYTKESDLAYVGGAAVVVRKEVFDKLGGFDNDYFCYHEEVDFCWRARLMNYRILYVPNAVVFHEVSHSLGEASPLKEYLIERNRITTNIKNLGTINLILAFFYELVYASGKVVFFVSCGKKQILAEYLKATAFVLKNLKLIWKKRLYVQSSRENPDNSVLTLHRRRSIVQYIKAAKQVYLKDT